MSPILQTFANGSVRGWAYSLGESAWISRTNTNEGSRTLYTASIAVNSDYVYTGWQFYASAQAGFHAIGVINKKTGVVTAVKNTYQDQAGYYTRVSTNNSKLVFGSNFRVGISPNGTPAPTSGRSYSGNGANTYVAIASDNSFYSTQASNSTFSPIVKFDSSCNVVWSKQINQNGSNPTSICVDASDNVFVTNNALIVKVNSSGVTQWTRQTNNGSDYSFVAADSSDNVFYAQFTFNGTAHMAKYNSAGTIQWSKTFGSAPPIGLAADASGNSYVHIYDSTLGRTVIKFDPAGNVMWQRRVSTSVGSLSFFRNSLTVDKTSYYFGAYIGAVNGVVVKLPLDGSKSGTYNINGETWTIDAGSIPVSNGGISENNPNVGVFTYTPTTSSVAWSLTDNTNFSQGPIKIL